MIVIDTSRMVIASATNGEGYSIHNSEKDNINLIKHIFYNTLRYYNKKFSPKYGEIVFAIDSRNYWRKSMFPYYKENRKKKRENSDFDWGLIFKIKDELIQELMEYFPYHVIEVDGAEADDIIATIVKFKCIPHIIIADDHDLIQLCNEHVELFSPRKHEKIVSNIPVEEYLFEHIICGDSGDGIPNIKSVPNSFVDKIRQKPISKIFLQECKETGIPPEFRKRFLENQQLIDLNKIPQDIVTSIINEWDNKPIKDYSKMFNFFARNGYKLLLQDIGDF